MHCVKSVRIRSFYGLYFPAFGMTAKRYGVFLRIQSRCGKIRPEKLRKRILFTQCYGPIIPRSQNSFSPFMHNVEK